MAKFEIRRRSPSHHEGTLIFDDECVKGIALGGHASDSTKADLADGDNFIGFVTRPVSTDGAHTPPDGSDPNLYQDMAFQDSRIEFPFKAGGNVSIEKADAVEVESPDNLLDSGTGAVSDSSPVGTKLSFVDGKFYIAQGSDIVYYTLTAQLDPEEAGKVRILAERA